MKRDWFSFKYLKYCIFPVAFGPQTSNMRTYSLTEKRQMIVGQVLMEEVFITLNKEGKKKSCVWWANVSFFHLENRSIGMYIPIEGLQASRWSVKCLAYCYRVEEAHWNSLGCENSWKELKKFTEEKSNRNGLIYTFTNQLFFTLTVNEIIAYAVNVLKAAVTNQRTESSDQWSLFSLIVLIL